MKKSENNIFSHFFSGMSNFSTDFGWSDPTIISIDSFRPVEPDDEPFKDSNIHEGTVNVQGCFIGTHEEADEFIENFNAKEEAEAVEFEG